MRKPVGTVVFNTQPARVPSVYDVLDGARMTFWLSGTTRDCYHFADDPMDADIAGTTNDWFAVADDLHHAIDEVTEGHVPTRECADV